MRYQYLIVIYFFLLYSFCFSQVKNDSLKKIWLNKSLPDSTRFNALATFYKINNQSNPDVTLKTLEYYYELAKEKNSIRELFNVANDRGGIYRLKGNSDLAMEYYLVAEKYALQINDSILQANVLGNIGNVYIQRKDYVKATRYFWNSLYIHRQTKNLKGESHMLTSLGSVFLIIQNYELATEYYNKALELSQKTKLEPRRIAIIYLNIGWSDFERKDFKNANVNYEKALEILTKTEDKFFMVNCYLTLASINYELKNIDKAKSYALKGLNLSRELSLKNSEIESNIIQAKINSLTNLSESIIMAESILKKLPKSSPKETKRNLYEFLYQSYKTKNLHKQSLEMFELYTVYNDSILAEKNKFAVIREAVKKDFDYKIDETKRKSTIEINSLKEKQNRNLIYIICFSILIVTLVFIYFRKKLNQNRNRRNVLLNEIETLKQNTNQNLVIDANVFSLNREKIENSITRKLNETDWNVLNALLDNPEITNKDLAQKVFLSLDGTGSSLRRMYEYFEIKDTKYKKIALISNAIKRSSK